MGMGSGECGGKEHELWTKCPNAKTSCVDYETPPSPPSTWRQGRPIQKNIVHKVL